MVVVVVVVVIVIVIVIVSSMHFGVRGVSCDAYQQTQMGQLSDAFDGSHPDRFQIGLIGVGQIPSQIVDCPRAVTTLPDDHRSRAQPVPGLPFLIVKEAFALELDAGYPLPGHGYEGRSDVVRKNGVRAPVGPRPHKCSRWLPSPRLYQTGID